jgi:methylated-DNA-[protein]-cysteine S-methyltransferase
MTLFDPADTTDRPDTPARIAAEVRLKPRESTTVARATAEAARLALAQDLIDSPVGPMLAIAGEDGLHSLWFLDADHGLSPRPAPNHPGHRWIEQARRELDEYFAGRRLGFDVPLKPHGTPFQESVWHELLKIGCGTTTSYGTIARALGKPNAFRAVGLAVGRNPISILVPCHRVVGENGTLTGYAGGLPRKRFLLGLELKADTLPLTLGAAASDRLRR